jgi:nicotinate-nucleotide adenylyltransferase
MPPVPQRLGVYGGTFDPIHNGHLHVATEALRELALDRLLLVPNGRPAHRSGACLAAPAHRLAMARLAAEPFEAMEVSDAEIVRKGISYTVDTLQALTEQRPGCRLFFITGVDAVAELPTWHDPERVLALSSVVAAARPGFTREWLAERLPAGWMDRILLLETTHSDTSATEVRGRIATGASTEGLVPYTVLRYIHRHRLYRGEEPGRPPSNL